MYVHLDVGGIGEKGVKPSQELDLDNFQITTARQHSQQTHTIIPMAHATISCTRNVFPGGKRKATSNWGVVSAQGLNSTTTYDKASNI